MERRPWIRDAVLIAVLSAAAVLLPRVMDDPSRFSTASAEVDARFSYLSVAAGTPAAWDCAAAIPLALNLDALAPSLRDDVRADLVAAIAAIESVSPFRFTILGDSTAVPTTRWGNEWVTATPTAPVVFAVIPDAASDLARPDTAAVAGNFYDWTAHGELRAFAGYVLIDIDHLADYAPGAGHRSRQALFTHELLHVLNLGHTTHADSVLTAKVSDSLGSIGAGDIEGLNALAALGCEN